MDYTVKVFFFQDSHFTTTSRPHPFACDPTQ
jgi:hypothetical protein